MLNALYGAYMSLYKDIQKDTELLNRVMCVSNISEIAFCLICGVFRSSKMSYEIYRMC